MLKFSITINAALIWRLATGCAKRVDSFNDTAYRPFPKAANNSLAEVTIKARKTIFCGRI